jgi:hypothetical protein
MIANFFFVLLAVLLLAAPPLRLLDVVVVVLGLSTRAQDVLVAQQLHGVRVLSAATAASASQATQSSSILYGVNHLGNFL